MERLTYASQSTSCVMCHFMRALLFSMKEGYESYAFCAVVYYDGLIRFNVFYFCAICPYSIKLVITVSSLQYPMEWRNKNSIDGPWIRTKDLSPKITFNALLCILFIQHKMALFIIVYYLKSKHTVYKIYEFSNQVVFQRKS